MAGVTRLARLERDWRNLRHVRRFTDSLRLFFANECAVHRHRKEGASHSAGRSSKLNTLERTRTRLRQCRISEYLFIGVVNVKSKRRR